MPQLKLRLLGAPQLEFDGSRVELESRKALALAAYLAVSETTQRRDHLAALLWPEADSERARASLRHSLWRVKNAIGEEHLDTHGASITLMPSDEFWVDVRQFQQRLDECRTHGHPIEDFCSDCIDPLTEAAELYRGDFLTGFSLGHCPEFDQWQFFETESLRRQAASAHDRLARAYAEQGQGEQAIETARRLTALDPLHEPAHRLLMELYTQAGRRSAALRQYHECVRLLDDELGVAPAAETSELYERIEAVHTEAPGRRPAAAAAFDAPQARARSFPDSVRSHTDGERVHFVGRKAQLAALEEHLAAALEGDGRAVFVAGESGLGKTALLKEFARRAQNQHSELTVAVGVCTALFGVADPYLPFTDILDMLTGEVDRPLHTSRVTPSQAQRLWELGPHTIQAIVHIGPHLIGTMIPGPALVERAHSLVPDAQSWLHGVQDRVRDAARLSQESTQSKVLEHYEQVLQTLAEWRPLLLLLDDLQWMDSASASLLYHLARRSPGKQILIVGAYRSTDAAPEALAAGQPTNQLQSIVHEVARRFGDVVVNLNQLAPAERQQFVNDVVDLRPNRLETTFRAELFRRTGGSALFTIEVLRDMRSRRDLVEQKDGRWTARPGMDWDLVPSRVQAVIQQRIGRLDDYPRELLRTASVEGQSFTAEAVANVLGLDHRTVVRELSRSLQRVHNLVQEQGQLDLVPGPLTRFRFNHDLFRQVLYESLTPPERGRIHAEIADALVALYGEHADDFAASLAHHYIQAGLRRKAVPYLLLAGDRARNLYANHEAAEHYEHALEQLKEDKDFDRAARVLMRLGLTHHNAFHFERSRKAYDEGLALWRQVTPAAADLPAPPHPLRFPWGPMDTLDPTRANLILTSSVSQQLFRGLVEPTPELDIVPDVAQRWDILDGGRKYVFHLRADAVWSDGVPVTARDFAVFWKRWLDPDNTSPGAQLFYPIRGGRDLHERNNRDPNSLGVEVLDEHTLAVELEAPTGYFLQLLAHGGSLAVPQHVIERHGEDWTDLDKIVTCGPFRIESWVQDSSLTLRRNPTYSGRSTGNIDTVELDLGAIPNPDASLARYESDQLDLTLVSPRLVARARKHYPEEFVSSPQFRTVYLHFNVNRPPLDDIRVRRALAMAVDVHALANVHFNGHFLPADGGLTPPGMPGHSPGIGLTYEPDRARELLAEAGYPGGRGIGGLEAIIPAIGGVSLAAEYLKEQWRNELGVEIEWNEIASWLKPGTHQPHLTLPPVWVADIPDPDNFLRVALRQQYTQWRHPEYDQLIERARRSTDQVLRIGLYQQAERILAQELPILPLVYPRLLFLVKPWVRKLPLMPLFFWSWKDVVLEPHE